MKSKERIFDYVKLLDDVKKRSNKNQSQISEELGCKTSEIQLFYGKNYKANKQRRVLFR